LAPLFLHILSSSRVWTLSLHPGAHRCLYLLMPLVLAAMYWRLDPLLDRFLASYLPDGSIAHMGYAWRLINGLSLIGTSGLSVVAFPSIAAHVAAGRRDAQSAELAHALRFSLFLMVPICLGLIAFAQPVVKLLFERGQFLPSDTNAVATLVALYAGVVLGVSLSDLLSRTFFALQEMLVPVTVSLIAFSLVAVLKFLVAKPFGAAGLVAATSIFYLLNTGALAAILLARLSPHILAGTAATLARSLAASLLACLVAYPILFWPHPLALLPAAAAGALSYALVMRLLGDPFATKLFHWLTPS
jgi:putative peptidoglycan lipid II flippase